MRSYIAIAALLSLSAAAPIADNAAIQIAQAQAEPMQCKKIHFIFARGTGESGTMGK
jgi:hypothetical protein